MSCNDQVTMSLGGGGHCPPCENIESSRKLYFDNCKGILIFLVVVGHFIVPLTSDETMMVLRKVIYVFHMPCFMIISGIFQKKRIDTRGAASGWGFLINFVIQNSIMYILMVMLETGSEYKHNPSYYHVTLGLWSFWYIQALFYYNTLMGMIKRTKLFYFGVIILYFALPYFNPVYAFNFTKAASYFIFFVAGYALFTEKALWVLRKPIVRWISSVILCILLLLSVKYHNGFTFDHVALNITYQSFEKISDGLMYRGLYLGAALIISGSLISVMPNRKGIFTNIGEHSNYIYVLHNYALALFYYLNRKLPFIPKINTTAEYLLFIVLCYVLCLVITSKLCMKKTKLLVEPAKVFRTSIQSDCQAQHRNH